MELVPIEYECKGVVTIRRCDEFISCIGNKPAYWYLKRPMFTMDAPEIGWSHAAIKSWKDEGFNVAYWDGMNWAPSTPKKFATPEEAMTEYQTIVKPRKS